MFATKGFMIAMHVPTSHILKKKVITRMLYRTGKKTNVNVKKEWTFLNEIEKKVTNISKENNH